MQALLPAALEDAAGRFRLERWHSVTVRTYGLAEAAVAEAIGPALSRHPDVSPAYYPSTSGVDVVLTSTRKSEVRSCATSAGRVLGNAVYEVGDRTLERVVGEMLKERGLRVATAESCTGGLIAARLTDVPGSSDYLAGGVVAYSNSVKSGVLEVATDTLRLHGAVSMPVAAEMASGACEVLDSDVGIAVTGIAGPGGATRSKPVGLVFAAVAMGRQVRVERRLYSGTRQMIRERSASAALDLCRRVLGESK
jgi:nicotinamide-nucleotide amidase